MIPPYQITIKISYPLINCQNYIEKWHRLPKTNFAYCFRSMLYWHCETGNIWSHLIGALLCIGLTIYFVTAPSDKFIASFEEKHLITLFLISAIVCLLFSTLYHTLSCHSERILRLFGRLDFSGIALLIMGSFVPWVYYSFYCTTQPRLGMLNVRSEISDFGWILGGHPDP